MKERKGSKATVAVIGLGLLIVLAVSVRVSAQDGAGELTG